MRVGARPAARSDLGVLVSLYRGLEKEMTALHPMWPLADGLPEPADQSIAAAIDEPDTLVSLGELEGIPVGFLLARVEPLLAEGEIIGVVRLVFVDPEAREVGVGEAMLALALDRLRQRGVTRFDAHVLPGHRLAKNFFEAAGFSARSIVMHHDDR
jgi:ribosomal protein S18 acetylase RimI-like enzyme